MTAEPEWVAERRRSGTTLASELELPTRKTRGWEFTDLEGFEPASYSPERASVEGLDRVAEEGIVVSSFAEALESHGDLLRERLGSLVEVDDPFVALNEAGLGDGLFVYVPRGKQLSEPVQVEVAHPSDGSAVNWRTVVIVEEGAEAEVWERYSSEGRGLFNGVVELFVEPGATLRYVCQQDLSEDTWVFASQRASVDRDATLEWVALGFGSERGKVRMETRLVGRGASAKVTGAMAGRGAQHLDYDTTQEHAAEDTVSDLAFRGVLTGSASSVWRGMIEVDPGAQRTDAFQESRNLILSERAHADAIPGLEILADDVACTHAAAIAQVDPDQLFYLKSRGLGDSDSRRLVIEGFLAELVGRAKEGPIRDLLAERLSGRLDQLLAESV
ncbi:Fe-S cluster assembly protein SufD [Thermoleophilia bacterium SCSIO 60948]|nr:Fe-S cluster assembly protein SufD [Thermoleophilia bacterium SCSIO 60948]